MRTTFCGMAIAAVLTVLIGAPAQAAIVHPSTVRLADASGVENGCVAKIPRFVLGSFLVDGADTPGVHMAATIKCPARADVHRLSFKLFLFEVRANGTLRGMNGPEGLLGQAVELFDAPLTGEYAPFGDDLGVLCGPQQSQNADKRTWLIRANFHTRHSATDPVPFVAKFDRQQTINCH